MKSQLRSVLFALVFSACGGDREAPRVSTVRPSTPVAGAVATSQPDVVKPDAVAVSPTPAPVVEPPAAPTVAVTAVESMPTTFANLVKQGRALADKGDHDRAKEMFEAAKKLDGKRAEPHLELAKLYIATGDKGLAVAEANKAVKLAPDSSQAWNTKGRAELNRFGYDDAIAAFQKAVELNKDNAWAWNNLGYTELQLKKYEDAAEHLGEATSRPGATGYMWNNLGIALEQLDRLDDARHAFEEGGKLGSKESLASRKRLDGVKSIALAKTDTSGKVDVKERETQDKTFELNEGPMEDPGVGSGSDQPASGSDVVEPPASTN